MTDGWRYFAMSLDGDGSDGEILHGDMSFLNNVTLTETLSGPGGLTATVSPEISALKDPTTGRPIFEEWGTAIWAQNGSKVYGGILTNSGFRGPEWSLECMGYAGYPTDQPWVGDGTYYVEADALDVVRGIWKHIQSQPNADLNLEFSHNDCGYVVGKILEEGYYDPQYRNELGNAREDVADHRADVRAAEKAVEDAVDDYKAKTRHWRNLRENRNASDAQVDNARDAMNAARDDVQAARAALRTEENQLDNAQHDLKQLIRLRDDPITYESDPLKLAEYMTTDLGGEIDELAETANFDYREQHWFDEDLFRHKIELGRDLGKRRDDLSFVIGENVAITPDVNRDGDEYANAVLLLGQGEGRLMKRGFAANKHSGLRRVAVVTDKSARTTKKANERARRELSRRQPLDDVTTIVVTNHPHARLGSYSVGDEIRLTGKPGWTDVNLWARITQISISPQAGDAAELSLVRSDKIGT